MDTPHVMHIHKLKHTCIHIKIKSLKEIQSQLWWRTLLISAFMSQRQVDLREFEASLVYRNSSRATRDTKRNPVS